MAKRGKARKSRVRFLVVHGSGNDTYVAIAPPPIADAHLASLVDRYPKSTRRVRKAKKAFLVEADAKIEAIAIETFTWPPPPPSD